MFLKIEIEDWDYNCGDGCCYEWGSTVTVNGVKLETNGLADDFLRKVLEHLGYKIDIDYK
jgi:hypothetical protein